MSPRITLRFPGTSYAALEVEAGCELSEHLTLVNSPVLFGCRTGLCGTCACLVEGELEPPLPDELEVLEAVAPAAPGARLACQLRPTHDLAVRRLPEAP